MTNLRNLRSFAGCALALGAAGCGAPAGPRLAKVTGKVTVDGKPVSGANLQMVSQEPGGSVSYGLTNSDGQYEMAFSPTKNGAFIGKNKLILTSGSQVAIGPEKYDGAEVFPSRYNTASEESFEVQAGSNVLDFDVKWGDFKPRKPQTTSGP